MVQVAINIYTVTDDLEANGWQLLSSSYKNLKTPLEMKCPKGHCQTLTYDEWRKHHRCEVCLAGQPYKAKGEVPAKSSKKRVLALDAATNVTGFSLYDDSELIKYGTFKASEQLETTERINQVKKWLIQAVKEWQPDEVALENIQLQKFGRNYQVEMYRVLACLQGVIADTLFESGIKFQLVYAAEWREHCGIKGDSRESKKKAAQSKVQDWYNLRCTQDEADAICIGKYLVGKKQKGSWGERL